MRKFDYVMIFTIYGKKITSQGSKSEFFYQIRSKDYVSGVKTLRNQTSAYQESDKPVLALALVITVTTNGR